MFTDYTEVRNTHLDETDGFWRIDAWETGDDSEEGKVVAYVHDKSGDAVICAPKARLSEKVKEAIKEKQEEIRGRDYPDVPDGYCCVHIYFGNPFPETVSKMIFKKAARVAWVGDYADNAEKYGCLYQKKKEDYPERPRRFTKKIYKDVWRKKGKESLPIISCSDSDQPGFSIAGKYLVNHSRREYLDCSAYEKRSRCKEQCIHPLPLLTAARNGMGSGDYRSEGLPCKKEVGRWCLDLISVEEEPPAGFACIDVTFREPG